MGGGDPHSSPLFSSSSSLLFSPLLLHSAHRVAQVHGADDDPAQHRLGLAVRKTLSVRERDLVPPVEVEVKARARQLDDGAVVRLQHPARAVGDPSVADANKKEKRREKEACRECACALAWCPPPHLSSVIIPPLSLPHLNARVLLEVGVHRLRQHAHALLGQVDVERFAVHGQEGLVQADGRSVVGERKAGHQRRALDRPLGCLRRRVQQARVLQLLRPELDLAQGQVEAHGQGEREQVGAWMGERERGRVNVSARWRSLLG